MKKTAIVTNYNLQKEEEVDLVWCMYKKEM